MHFDYVITAKVFYDSQIFEIQVTTYVGLLTYESFLSCVYGMLIGSSRGNDQMLFKLFKNVYLKYLITGTHM